MADFEINESETAGNGASRIPPYVPFTTFLTFLKGLKADGLPAKIDRSVLSKLSGSGQAQMKLALKSLGLMDGDEPTDKFRELVRAFETPEFNTILLERLKVTYPNVFKLELETATPAMLEDVFKALAKEDVARKCKTFFLHAAKHVGVKLGKRLATRAAKRSPNGTIRKKPKNKDGTKDEVHTPPPPPPDFVSDKALEYKLVDLMKEDNIGDPERQAIWTLIQYLTTKSRNKATDHD